ncbi:MAG: hypothetical protein HFE39_06570 [Clostridiales bacterium]|nr:hypothetical protein [Clostridiales bacterium]
MDQKKPGAIAGNDAIALLGGLVQLTMGIEGMMGSYFSARKRCFLAY